MIFTHRHFRGDLLLEADVVVVGTGAGGGPAAAVLAQTGKRVVVLEAGEWIHPADYNQREEAMLPRLFFDGGGRTTADKAIAIHQGKGIGGSTVHNTNLIKRVPDSILDSWYERHVWRHLPRRRLEAVYTAVEGKLNVRPIEEIQLNANNRILKRGAETLGYRGGMLSHNRSGCLGSGFCELGCAFNAKMNSQRVYVPEAVRAGATVLTDCWVTGFEHDGGRARRLHAWIRDPTNGHNLHRVEVRFRFLLLAASSTGTPAILRRSGAPDPHGQIGNRLHLHPGIPVVGLFDEPVRAWQGIPQSYEVTQFLDFREGAEHRVWIVTAFAHPIGSASLVPGFGDPHRDLMRHYAHLAVVSPMLHDESSGTVRPKGDFGVKIGYRLEESDRSQLQLGIRESARLLFAGGAREVLLPLEIPVRIGAPRELGRLEDHPWRPHRGVLTSVHPMSSCPMSDDPRRGAVDSDGRVHGLENVYVADASLYPTSIGGPPQLTAYAMGIHVGQGVAARL